MKTKTHIFYIFFLVAVAAMSSCSTSKKIDAPAVSLSDERMFSYYYHEAVRQRLLQNYDVAIEMLMMCYHTNSQNAALMSEFANVYSLVGKFDYAIFYQTKAVELDDENVWYQINLANLYLTIGDTQTATEVYEFAVKKHPKNDELNYKLMGLYMKQQRYEQVIDILNRIEKRQGVLEETSFEKIRIYYGLQEKKKAAGEVEALINAFPNEMKYRILHGSFYMENNEAEKALKIYKYVLEKEKDNVEARLALAEYYEKNEKYDKAASEIEHVLRTKNVEVETKLNILGNYLNFLLKDKDNDEHKKQTLATIDTLLDFHPNVPEIRQYRAAYLAELKQYDEAVAELNSVLNADVKNEMVWKQLLDVTMYQEKNEEAAEIAIKAAEIFPEKYQFLVYQGAAYIQLGKTNEAANAYEKALELLSPNDNYTKSNIHGQLGDLYFEMKEENKAFENYEKALEENPYNSHVLNNYSYYLAEKKQDLSKAEAMAKKCLGLAPNDNTILDTYAWVLFRQGYFNLAKRYLEQALTNGGDASSVIVEHYGDVLYRTGDIAEALNMWKKSLEMGNKSEVLPLKIEKEKYIDQD